MPRYIDVHHHIVTGLTSALDRYIPFMYNLIDVCSTKGALESFPRTIALEE